MTWERGNISLILVNNRRPLFRDRSFHSMREIVRERVGPFLFLLL
jgi:hypothetical protein